MIDLSNWFVKWFIALPMIVFLGLMMLMFMLIGFVGWVAMQMAGVCFGTARGILTAYERQQRL